MIVVVGLGNPGKEYVKTVHNCGYMAIEHFAKTHNIEFTKNKYFAKYGECVIGGEKVILLKPETFMNSSGKCVLDILQSLKLEASQILVLVDDIDLDFGAIRLRAKGSGGTHNGLRDIVQKIGENFARVRIGVGKPDKCDLVTFVLSRLPDDKVKALNDRFDIVDKAIEYYVAKKSFEGLDITRL